MPALVFSQIYSFQSYFISGVSVLPEGTYANCTFTCTSGSVIRLKAELYSFYSCTFESYSGPDLWEGIYVPNQGSAAFVGCRFYNAVTSVKGFVGAHLNFRSCTFVDNKYGIYMDGTSNQSFSNSKLSANYNEFYGTTNGINDPTVGNHSLVGIEVNDMAAPNITDGNYFHDLQNGIILRNSNLHYFNLFFPNKPLLGTNVYENIQPKPGSINLNENGNGILVEGGKTGISTIWLDGGSSYYLPSYNFTGNYNFINCKVGVKAVNANLHLNFNDFLNCERAILVTGVKSSNIQCNIEKNKIVNSFIGIDLVDNHGGPIGTIYRDTIVGGNMSVNGCGVRALNALGFSSSNIVIKENNIQVNRSGMTGIQSSGVSDLKIYDNKINISGSLFSYKGIHLLNTANDNLIAENDITGSEGPVWIESISDERNGIKVEGCMQSDIGCNNVIAGVGAGLQILDDCDNSKIYKNTFNNSGVGLLYGQPYTYPGKSGNQFGKLNQWTGSFAKAPAWWSVDYQVETWILESQYHAVPKYSVYHPYGILNEDLLNDWFKDEPGGSPDPCKQAVIGGPQDDALNDHELNIVNGVPGSQEDDAAHYWNTRWNLFNKLKRSPDLTIDSTIESYINAEAQTNLGRFHESWSLINNFVALDSIQRQQYDYLQDSLQRMLIEAQDLYQVAYEEQLLYGSVTGTTKDSINSLSVLINQSADSLVQLGQIIEEKWTASVFTADSILGKIIPATIQEQLQWDVQKVYLSVLLSGEIPDSIGKIMLHNMADECPNTHGQGVWWARNIYRIFNQNDTTNYVKWCVKPESRQSSYSEKEVNTDIVLYPNPGMEHLTVSGLDIRGGAEIVIKNVTGIPIVSIKTEGTNEATIPTSHLANGLYLVIISQGGSNTVKTWAKSTR